MESVVLLPLLVQSMKVTVTKTLNAKEALSVGEAIVLQIFHLAQIAAGAGAGAVNPSLVSKYHGEIN